MSHIVLIESNCLDIQQKESLLKLWNTEYPTNLAYSNINEFEKYLNALKAIRHILLVKENREIVGWTFAFNRDNERWFVIILASSIQGKGFGKLALDKLKVSEKELNGWVIDNNFYLKANGEKYLSPLEFYQKMGFSVLTDSRLELEHISAVKIKWQG